MIEGMWGTCDQSGIAWVIKPQSDSWLVAVSVLPYGCLFSLQPICNRLDETISNARMANPASFGIIYGSFYTPVE